MHAADEDDDEEDAPAQKKPAKAKPAKVQTAGWAQAWRMQAPVHFCPLSLTSAVLLATGAAVHRWKLRAAQTGRAP